MPNLTILTPADIRRAYICPTWFKRHREITREIDPPDTPQEMTRQTLEWWLPGILASPDPEHAKGYIDGCIADVLKPAILTAYENADPDHRGLMEDVWLREKNLFVGVAALLSQVLDNDNPARVPAKIPLFSDTSEQCLQPCSVTDYGSLLTGVRYHISSTVSDEAQIRADSSLGAEAHALKWHGEFERLHVQEIIVGRRADQWYENPLCRYWRHDNGAVSFTGLTPDGKQCRAPHWMKVPVFNGESTDPNEIETMWNWVEWLRQQPEFDLSAILPDPVVIEIGDHQQAQFADALRVLDNGFAETPVRNYTACYNPVFFPHGCPLRKECWG